MVNINLNKNDILGLLFDYDTFDENDIMDEQECRVRKIKRALSKLDAYEKIIFLMYVENNSYRKCAEILGVSTSTFSTIYKEIRDKIIDMVINDDEIC